MHAIVICRRKYMKCKFHACSHYFNYKFSTNSCSISFLYIVKFIYIMQNSFTSSTLYLQWNMKAICIVFYKMYVETCSEKDPSQSCCGVFQLLELFGIIIWQASLPVKWRTVIGWETLSAVHYFPVMAGGPLRKNKRMHF
jgi:hypothetical protein